MSEVVGELPRVLDKSRLSSVRCRECRGPLIDILAAAGETTHPACYGWPTLNRLPPWKQRPTRTRFR